MLRLALHWQILIGMVLGAAIGLPLNILAESGRIDPSVPRTIATYGNELGGLQTPGLLVPLATYTGWNLYNAEYGPTDTGAHMSGSFIPFHATRAEREAQGDPRLSIEERYENRDHYLGLVAAEAMQLIDDGYLLDQDLPEILEQAGIIWDSIMN